jgi:hypothetical protein
MLKHIEIYLYLYVQLLVNILGPDRGNLCGIFGGMTSGIHTSHLVLL